MATETPLLCNNRWNNSTAASKERKPWCILGRTLVIDIDRRSTVKIDLSTLCLCCYVGDKVADHSKLFIYLVTSIYYWFLYPHQTTFKSLRTRCYIKQKINSTGKALLKSKLSLVLSNSSLTTFKKTFSNWKSCLIHFLSAFSFDWISQ